MGKFLPKFLTFKGKYNFKKQISLSKVTLQLSQLLVGQFILKSTEEEKKILPSKQQKYNFERSN